MSSSHQPDDEVVIGIDLGTSNSCVAVMELQRVNVLANDLGSRLTPSIVYLGEEHLVGAPANEMGVMEPQRTIFAVKRMIGRRFDDPVLQNDLQYFPYKVIDRDNTPYIAIQRSDSDEYDYYTPHDICGVILQSLKKIAGQFFGHTISKAVITVPANFNSLQRNATKEAARIAGLQVVRMLNEPTAAAFAYGYQSLQRQKEKEHILIYDFGGGTLDVSTVIADHGIFKVLGTCGDTHLGGADFDNILVEHALKQFQKQTGQDVRSNQRALRKLHVECEKAKCSLSSLPKTYIEVTLKGDEVVLDVTRVQFEKLAARLFRRCMKPITTVLQQSGLSADDIDDIILVGGTTRIPKVQQMIMQQFPAKFASGKRELSKTVNPDEVVATGAAVQAAVLSQSPYQKIDAVQITDVVHLCIGVERQDGSFEVILPRNELLPIERSVTLTLQQLAIVNNTKLRLLEGEVIDSNDPEDQDDNSQSTVIHPTRICLDTIDVSSIISARSPPSTKLQLTFYMDLLGNLSLSVLPANAPNGVGIRATFDGSKLVYNPWHDNDKLDQFEDAPIESEVDNSAALKAKQEADAKAIADAKAAAQAKAAAEAKAKQEADARAAKAAADAKAKQEADAKAAKAAAEAKAKQEADARAAKAAADAKAKQEADAKAAADAKAKQEADAKAAKAAADAKAAAEAKAKQEADAKAAKAAADAKAAAEAKAKQEADARAAKAAADAKAKQEADAKAAADAKAKQEADARAAKAAADAKAKQEADAKAAAEAKAAADAKAKQEADAHAAKAAAEAKAKQEADAKIAAAAAAATPEPEIDMDEIESDADRMVEELLAKARAAAAAAPPTPTAASQSTFSSSYTPRASTSVTPTTSTFSKNTFTPSSNNNSSSTSSTAAASSAAAPSSTAGGSFRNNAFFQNTSSGATPNSTTSRMSSATTSKPASSSYLAPANTSSFNNNNNNTLKRAEINSNGSITLPKFNDASTNNNPGLSKVFAENQNRNEIANMAARFGGKSFSAASPTTPTSPAYSNGTYSSSSIAAAAAPPITTHQDSAPLFHPSMPPSHLTNAQAEKAKLAHSSTTLAPASSINTASRDVRQPRSQVLISGGHAEAASPNTTTTLPPPPVPAGFTSNKNFRSPPASTVASSPSPPPVPPRRTSVPAVPAQSSVRSNPFLQQDRGTLRPTNHLGPQHNISAPMDTVQVAGNSKQRTLLPAGSSSAARAAAETNEAIINGNVSPRPGQHATLSKQSNWQQQSSWKQFGK